MAITFGSKPAEFKYVELPWDAIAAAGAAKQKRYDEGDQTITNINDTFLKIGSRQIDTKRKQELVDGFQQEIYNITDNFSGDIGAALPKIKELQRKLNYEITYGELGAIKKNYELEQARIKKIQESLDSYNQGKGGLDAYDAAALLAFDAQVNNVPTQKVGNTWSTYQEKTPIYATQDYSQAARNIAKDIDIQSLEEFSGMKHIGNGIFMDEKRTEERRDKDIIEEYVTNALLADPKYAQYLNWKNTITGKNDKVANVLQNNTVTTPEGITYLPKLDAAGNEIGVMNPTAWANDYLTSDFRQAGRSAGEIYQRLKISRDRKYATPDLGSGKEEEAPAIGLNVLATPIANQEQFATQAKQAKNQFGQVVDARTGKLNSDQSGGVVAKGIEKGWAALKGMWNYTVASLQAGIPGMQAEGAAKQIMASKNMMNELEEIGRKYDNPREGLSKQSEEMKKGFPGLQSIRPEMVQESSDVWFEKNWPGGLKRKDTYFSMMDQGLIQKKYDRTSGTYKYPHEIPTETYDNNAGIVFNNYTMALEKASQQAGTVTRVPEKNAKAIETYFERILPYGTLTTKNNPKNPELSMQELVDESGQLKNIKFVGISDAASGGKFVFNINGKEAIFHPSDQITNSKLVVTQAISQSFQTQKPQVIALSNGNQLRIQPDILPSNGQSFSTDGSNAEYMVRVEQYDNQGNPVNFPGLQTNNLRGEQYYQLYELPSLLGALGVK